MGQSHPRPGLTTCSASSRPRAKRKTTCRRGKEHLYLLRQKLASLWQILHRVPLAQIKSHKKTSESLETRKKADLVCSLQDLRYHVRGQREAQYWKCRARRAITLTTAFSGAFGSGAYTPSLVGTKLVSSFHQPMNSLKRLVLSLATTFPVSVFIIRSSLNSFSTKWLTEPPMFLSWAPP